MDYEKLKEALNLIKKTCGDSSCHTCPLGHSCGICLLTDVSPVNWDITDKQATRLLV